MGRYSRWECAKIRDAYDKGNYGRNLEAAFKYSFSSETSLQRALTLLISGDSSLNPMGSDREQGDDEAEATRAGKRARTAADEKYDKKRTQAMGEEAYKERRSGVAGLFSADPDNEDVPNFVLDAKSRSNDLVELTIALRQATEISEMLVSFKDNVKDEVVAMRENFLAVTSHCYEMETWIAIYKGHIKALKQFNEVRKRRDTAFKEWKSE
jgi:hypothetical protein